MFASFIMCGFTVITATDNVLQANVYIFNTCIQYHIAVP